MFPIGRLRSALRVGAPSNSLRQPICSLVAGIPAADDQVLVPVVGTRGGPTVGLYIQYTGDTSTGALVRSEHKSMKMVY